MDLVFVDGVVNGFTQPVEDGGIGIHHTVPDIVIGVTEIVVARIVFIQMEQGEDVTDVHQTAAGIGQRTVMKPGKGQIQLFERGPDIGSCHFPADTGGQISAVEFADSAGGFFHGVPCDVYCHCSLSFFEMGKFDFLFPVEYIIQYKFQLDNV